MMRYALPAFLLLLPLLALASEVDLGSVSLANNTVVTLNLSGFPYGGATGTVALKFGDKTWYPSNLWLVPDGTATGQFEYTSLKTVPSTLNLTNDCRTSFYANATSGKKAYKAAVQANGAFCILGDPGTYRIIAEY